MSLRILLVEDQRDLSRTLRRVLTARGFHVTVADSCAEALKRDVVMDCAVLDIDLPDGSGLDLARTLLDKGNCNAVVFFSGQTDPHTIQGARDLGGFVCKSSGVRDLITAVVERVREARHASSQDVSGRYPKIRRNPTRKADCG